MKNSKKKKKALCELSCERAGDIRHSKGFALTWYPPELGITLNSRDFDEKQVPAGCSHDTCGRRVGKRGGGRL